MEEHEFHDALKQREIVSDIIELAEDLKASQAPEQISDIIDLSELLDKEDFLDLANQLLQCIGCKAKLKTDWVFTVHYRNGKSNHFYTTMPQWKTSVMGLILFTLLTTKPQEQHHGITD